MPYRVANQFYRCIEPLQAEETMSNITTASFPHFGKKEDKNKVWSRLKKSMRILDQGTPTLEKLFANKLKGKDGN